MSVVLPFLFEAAKTGGTFCVFVTFFPSCKPRLVLARALPPVVGKSPYLKRVCNEKKRFVYVQTPALRPVHGNIPGEATATIVDGTCGLGVANQISLLCYRQVMPRFCYSAAPPVLVLKALSFAPIWFSCFQTGGEARFGRAKSVAHPRAEKSGA